MRRVAFSRADAVGGALGAAPLAVVVMGMGWLLLLLECLCVGDTWDGWWAGL